MLDIMVGHLREMQGKGPVTMMYLLLLFLAQSAHNTHTLHLHYIRTCTYIRTYLHFSQLELNCYLGEVSDVAG